MKLKLFSIIAFGVTIGMTGCDLLEEETTATTIEVTSDVESPTTWTSNNTYIIEGSLHISADLTIEPGTIIKFKQGAQMQVAYWSDDYATVKAIGTQDNPIRFTSYAPSPTAGDYDFIGFYAGANNCEFVHCIFEYGGNEEYAGVIYIDETNVKFDNCQFLNIKNSAINLVSGGSFTQFTNNTFTSIEKNAIVINANKVHTIGEGNEFNVGSQYGISVNNDFNIAGTYTWLAHNAPYIITDNIHIGTSGNGITLNINAGAILKFANDKGFKLAYWGDEYAKIKAHGTATSPIVFTSNSTAPQAGDYNGLYFYNGSALSEFTYCTFEYAGKDSYNGGIYIEEANIAFNNCNFNNMKNDALVLKTEGRFTEFTNNHFAANQGYSISITSNFVHTIGAGNSFEDGSLGILVSNDLNIAGNYTWLSHEVPYVISENIHVGAGGNGVTLNINPGTTLAFNLEKRLRFAYWGEEFGKIIANGTAANPIIFTSAAPTPAKGDWNGLYFYEGSSGSALSYCEVLYAGRDNYFGAFMLEDAGHNTISLTNSRIAYSQSHAITVDSDSSIDYSTVTFDNNNGSDYHER